MIARTCFTLIVLAAGPAAAGHSQGTKPAVYELYSWEELAGNWYFSLLENTSSEKTVREVFDRKRRLHGVDVLERRISELPAGSTIVWLDRIPTGTGPKAKGSEKLRYPPADIMVAVKRFAAAHGVEVIDSGSSAQQGEQEPPRIPGIVASYAYLAQTFQDFPSFLDLPSSFRFREAGKALESSFDAVKCDLTTRMAFSTQVEVVPLANPADARTVRWFEPGVATTNFLVVTTPIDGLGRRSVVLLSSASPRRTSILLVAGDLSARLVYDSIKKPIQDDVGPMGVVREVQVSPGVLSLLEQTQGLEQRQYVIDLATGQLHRREHTEFTPGARNREP